MIESREKAGHIVWFHLHENLSATKCIVTESRLGVIWGWGCQEERRRKKGRNGFKKRRNETFRDAAFVYYLDCDYALTGIYMCKNI